MVSKLSDLYQEVASYGPLPAEYVEKMLHDIPKAAVVDRVEHLAQAVAGKVVLDLGAVGPVSQVLRQKAAEYHAADKVPGDGANYHQMDLDRADRLPDVPGLELIVAGEVIEHLSNAGHFLDLLHSCGVPVVLTTPNAFTTVGRQYLAKGIECVNREHVAWYSYRTLKTLIERHGFQLIEWYWYNGKPLTAEGLIFYIKPLFAVRGGFE